MTVRKAKSKSEARRLSALMVPKDNHLTQSISSYLQGVRDCMDLIDLALFDISDIADAEHTLRVLRNKMEELVNENKRAL